MSKQPAWNHQLVCVRLAGTLDRWSSETGVGVANAAPGVIFDAEDDVAPDEVWVSRERLSNVLGDDGKLHAAPDLVVEVLSSGPTNERRDREANLKLHAERGVREYWIADWRQCQVEVYRREAIVLHLVGTLFEQDTLESPLLPGFACPVHVLFAGIPAR